MNLYPEDRKYVFVVLILVTLATAADAWGRVGIQEWFFVVGVVLFAAVWIPYGFEIVKKLEGRK